jgi:hypothetical protein
MNCDILYYLGSRPRHPLPNLNQLWQSDDMRVFVWEPSIIHVRTKMPFWSCHYWETNGRFLRSAKVAGVYQANPHRISKHLSTKGICRFQWETVWVNVRDGSCRNSGIDHVSVIGMLLKMKFKWFPFEIAGLRAPRTPDQRSPVSPFEAVTLQNFSQILYESDNNPSVVPSSVTNIDGSVFFTLW